MFSGLIQARGVVVDSNMDGDDMVLVIDGGKDFFATATDNNKKLGASIAVNGVCLTIAAWQGNSMVFHLSRETLARTTASNWQKNQLVNLEESLRMGDELGGHFVSGHVDDMGEVTRVEKKSAAWQLNIKVPPQVATMMATKGSVAIDGCSLTINDVAGDSIAISLIPHTITHTIAEFYTIGQKVNIEIDMLMRYVMRALNTIKG